MNIELLSKVSTCHNGCWNSFLVVDGSTYDYHIENYCASTFISISNQVSHASFPVRMKPYFSFKLSDKQNLYGPMSVNFSFLFNAKSLTHRQVYTPSDYDKDPYFYNVASYCNAKLFNHLKKSFERMENKN